MTIVSASRRTDIPNYFGDWFFNRLRAVSIVTAALPPVNRKNAAGRAL